MILLALGLLLAGPAAAAGTVPDPVQALLAPGPADLARSITRTRQLLSQAEAVGLATARVQNRWQALVPDPRAACGPPEAADLALRAELLGHAWWERLQSARAELDRAHRAHAAPTMQPLLSAADDRNLADLDERAARSSTQYLVASSVQAGRIRAWRGRCPATLRTGPGLPADAPQARDEAAVGTALILRAGGVLCPDPAGGDAPVSVPVDGEVVVLGTPAGCWSTSGCEACPPTPLLPGAVVGPTPAGAEAAP